MRPRPAISATAALIAAACLAGCGGNPPQANPVVTVTATQPAPTETVTQEPTSPPPSESSSPPEADKKTLPNVVGMNLQAGQDTMQEAGFYVLDDQDATGQGRFQVYDRNWVVTRQTPAAGRKVSLDTKVTLYAKKIGE